MGSSWHPLFCLQVPGSQHGSHTRKKSTACSKPSNSHRGRNTDNTPSKRYAKLSHCLHHNRCRNSFLIPFPNATGAPGARPCPRGASQCRGLGSLCNQLPRRNGGDICMHCYHLYRSSTNRPQLKSKIHCWTLNRYLCTHTTGKTPRLERFTAQMYK